MECRPLETASEATQTIVCVASSQYWWAVPLILGISLIVAIVGVFNARAVARQRATLDLIEKFESSPDYRDISAKFLYHCRSNSFDRLHDPSETQDKEQREKVLSYLNHYELVAIGTFNNILDKKIYYEWMRGPLVQDWNNAADFVQRERWKWDEKEGKWVYYNRSFENFQKLAQMFSPDAKILDQSSGGPPEKPEGVGDESVPRAPE